MLYVARCDAANVSGLFRFHKKNKCSELRPPVGALQVPCARRARREGWTEGVEGAEQGAWNRGSGGGEWREWSGGSVEGRERRGSARCVRGSMCRVLCALCPVPCAVLVCCATCAVPLCCVLQIIILCRVLACSVSCAGVFCAGLPM